MRRFDVEALAVAILAMVVTIVIVLAIIKAMGGPDAVLFGRETWQ